MNRAKWIKLVLVVVAAGAAAAAASGVLSPEISSLLTSIATALGGS